MYSTLSQFLHRPNPDNSYTSICTRCFGRVGSGEQGDELERAEKNHVCSQRAVRQLGTMSE